jgi:cbb3-type cytochrome oxidase maturation protein
LTSLYLLIPIALVFCAIAIKLLLWAINNGQYDDLDKEAWRILSDTEDAAQKPPAAPLADPAEKTATDE